MGGFSEVKVMRLPVNVDVEGVNGSVSLLGQQSYIFAKKINLFEKIKYFNNEYWDNGAIVTCGGLSVAIIGSKDFFLFDS